MCLLWRWAPSACGFCTGEPACEVGDVIEIDETLLEIETDKVDSEVASEVNGVLVEKFFNVDDIVQAGQTLAIIETEGVSDAPAASPVAEPVQAIEKSIANVAASINPAATIDFANCIQNHHEK